MAEGETLGDAAERWIADGEINPLKSITSGANDAIGGVIYGKDPLKSVGSALVRGGGSGAVTGGINYISETLGSVGQTGAGAYRGMAGALVSGALSSYISGRDPRSGCGSSGMPGQGLGYSAARGYQYSTGQAENFQGRKEKFSLGGFFQEVLTEGVTEALSSAGSFGLGKVVDKVKRSICSLDGHMPLSIIIGDSHGNELERAYKVAGPSTPEVFNVFGHGAADGIQFRGRKLNAEEVAKLIRNSKHYVGGKQKIKLYSCSTGSKKNGFAQQLADILQTEVEAPNRNLYIKEGEFEVCDVLKLAGHKKTDYGEWITFNPRR